MAITISRGQRDAIHKEIALDLSGLTDLWTEFGRGEFERARELRRRFERDMRLLDDLGWEPEQDRDEFELTMEAADLAAAIVHLNTQTGAILHTDIVEPIERSPDTARSVMAQIAFGAILAQLAQGSPSTKAIEGDR